MIGEKNSNNNNTERQILWFKLISDHTNIVHASSINICQLVAKRSAYIIEH